MNSPSKFCFSLCLMAALALRADADTFTLKNGTSLEGTILREDATSYVIEVQVTKSIKDERIIAKEDVIKVEGEKKDLVAFEPISKFIPAPDALTADEYASRISSVEKFIKEHGESTKVKQAEAILSVLKKEANEILAGGIKSNGKLVTASEYRANLLDTDASIREAEVRALLKDGQYLTALRAFSALDRDFSNTKSRAALLPQIIQTINGYLAQTSQTLAAHDALIKERDAGLQRMQIDDRRQTQAALAEEAAGFEKLLKQEKESKIGWVTTQPSYKPSLEETMAFGKTEIARLTSAATPPAVDAGTAFRDALRKIQNSTNAAAKSAALAEAKAAMVSGKYLGILETAAATR